MTKKFKHIGINSNIGPDFEIQSPQNISIGDNFSAGRFLRIEAWSSYQGKDTGLTPSITIGNNVSMMTNCQISCCRSVSIGDGTLMGDNVFITDNFHGTSSFEDRTIAPAKRDLYIKGAVHIGKNVWIGRNVCILPNVSIGDGAIIGANAVVTHDVPAMTTALGIPARTKI